MFESTKASGTPVMVAIDVGMTYTGNDHKDSPSLGDKLPDALLGVAYIIKSPAIEMVEPWTIQNWPGNGAGKADKVGPSLLWASPLFISC